MYTPEIPDSVQPEIPVSRPETPDQVSGLQNLRTWARVAQVVCASGTQSGDGPETL